MNKGLVARDLIEKSYTLAKIQCDKLSLTDYRLINAYISQINARDEKTREVTFTLESYCNLLGISDIKSTSKFLKQQTRELLKKTMQIPIPSGGFDTFTLFDRCKVEKNKDGDWFVTIRCNEQAIPIFFNLSKDGYFKYRLGQMIKFKSIYDFRLYEFIKRNEYIASLNKGSVTYSVEDVRNATGAISKTFLEWRDFKKKILDKGQEQINNFQDVYFTYDLIRTGKGGKVTSIKFNICKNNNYIDQITIDEIYEIDKMDNIDQEAITNNYNIEICDYQNNNEEIDFAFFREAFDNKISMNETKELYHLALQVIQDDLKTTNIHVAMYDYLLLKYREVVAKKEVKTVYGYAKFLINLDIKNKEENLVTV